MTDPVKAKLIALVPDAFEFGVPKSPSLADVLRAIENANSSLYNYSLEIVNASLYFMAKEREFVAAWNLTTDYDGQTQDTKDFIGKLLNV